MKLAVIFIAIWSILLVIGVSDAQRHRIPNKLVGLLLLVVIVSLFQKGNIDWLLHLKGFVVTFIVGFGFYLCRAMAGGDVKFLAVIGLWLGAEAMWQATPFIVLAGGVVGIFYLALHMASSTNPIALQIKIYFLQRLSPVWEVKQPLVIPFAPAIVIGLAYYFYIN